MLGLQRSMVAATAFALLVGCGSCGRHGGTSTGLTLSPTVDKTCVHVGDAQRIVTKTAPHANVAYAVLYSDQALHGPPPRGDADKHGVFVGQFAIPNDAPAGEVRVRVLAAHGKQTANVVSTFRVVGQQESC